MDSWKQFLSFKSVVISQKTTPLNTGILRTFDLRSNSAVFLLIFVSPLNERSFQGFVAFAGAFIWQFGNCFSYYLFYVFNICLHYLNNVINANRMVLPHIIICYG